MDMTKIEPLLTGLPGATFEEAVAATKFGKFNILLMLLTIPPTFSQAFETTSMSYVLPIAQCDLHLALEDKGLLNAMTFAGMITSSFIWGYLCDTLGRKKIMVYGYLLNGFFVILGSLSTSVVVLMLAKFFGGFTIVGPFAAAAAYLSEFHSSEYRARVQLVRGMAQSLGNVVLPLMAWALLPKNFDFSMFGRYGHYHSWNVFILCCALAPLTSGISYIFMPESPKFLMSLGRNKEALQIFRKIYRINTGKPEDEFPIYSLIEEKNNEKKTSAIKALKEMCFHMVPLFRPPYILLLVLVCCSISSLSMSVNTLKLWLPQLFQIMNDYQTRHHGASTNICTMLDQGFHPKNISAKHACVVNLDNTSVYVNSITVGVSRIVVFAIAGLSVKVLGKKKLIVSLAVATGSLSFAIYFALNSGTVLALSSLGMSCGSVVENLVMTTALEVFPTMLRTAALNLLMLCGRLGTITGNVVFPYLLNTGCAPPFFFIGLLSLGCACLSMFFPNTENRALE